jgi:hypothetical protein
MATVEGDFAQCITKTTAQECNNGSCKWSNGKGLIPDHDFCAPSDLTTDVQQIGKCIATKDAATCVAPCNWRQGKQDPTKPSDPNTDPSSPVKESGYCKMSKPTIAASGSTPVTAAGSTPVDKTDASKVSTAGSTPVDKTEKTDATKGTVTTTSTDMCKDIKDSKACGGVPECEWVDTTKPDPSKPGDDTKPTDPSTDIPLFTAEFCHPVKIDMATVEGDFAQCITKTTAQECNNGSCKWSNGMGLIPDHDFCAPSDLTTDVQQIGKCIATKDAATCVAPCKWR